VEHLASERISGLRLEQRILPLPVKGIPNQRVARVLEVDPDLVRSAGMNPDFRERDMLTPGQDAVGGKRFTSTASLPADGHSLAVDAVAFNGGVYFSLTGNPGSAKKRQIDFTRRTLLELSGQTPVSGVVLGGNESAAGIFIEPVDNPRTRHASDAAQLPPAVMEQRIDNRMPIMAGSRMHTDSGHFVDDQQRLIFKQNIQLHILGLCLGRFGFRPVEGHEVARTGMASRADIFPIHLNMPLGNEALESRTGLLGIAGLQEDIHPLAGQAHLDSELLPIFFHSEEE